MPGALPCALHPDSSRAVPRAVVPWWDSRPAIALPTNTADDRRRPELAPETERAHVRRVSFQHPTQACIVWMRRSLVGSSVGNGVGGVFVSSHLPIPISVSFLARVFSVDGAYGLLFFFDPPSIVGSFRIRSNVVHAGPTFPATAFRGVGGSFHVPWEGGRAASLAFQSTYVPSSTLPVPRLRRATLPVAYAPVARAQVRWTRHTPASPPPDLSPSTSEKKKNPSRNRKKGG